MAARWEEALGKGTLRRPFHTYANRKTAGRAKVKKDKYEKPKLSRRSCSHLSPVHPKPASSTQQERQPTSRRPELVCSTPGYVTPSQPDREAHSAIFIMVSSGLFLFLDSLILGDTCSFAFSGILASKRQNGKEGNNEESPLCGYSTVPSHAGSPSLKMATRKTGAMMRRRRFGCQGDANTGNAEFGEGARKSCGREAGRRRS